MKGQAFLLWGALVLGSCSGTEREATLAILLDRASAHDRISDVIPELPGARGVLLGAVVSHSMQSSEGKRSNPRLIFELPDGTFVTTLLMGDSLELGLPGRVADLPLPNGLLSTEKGELLAEMRFPHAGGFRAREVLNRHDEAKRDTHGCTGCHVDVTTTKAAYGQLAITVGDEKFSALVSPTSFDDISSEALCVPRDLEKLARDCDSLTELDEEGCRRLKATLALAPRQHPRYAGDCSARE